MSTAFVDRLRAFVWPPAYGLPPGEPESVLKIEPEPDTRAERQPQEAVTFRDIIGQGDVLDLLRLEIAASRREGRRLSDLLFVGPAGLGKSLVTTATANEAGCVVFPATGPEFGTTQAAVWTFQTAGAWASN